MPVDRLLVSSTLHIVIKSKSLGRLWSQRWQRGTSTLTSLCCEEDRHES